MITRVFVLLLLSIAAAHAQSNCEVQFQFCPMCGDPGVPGATCEYESGYIAVCTAKSPACAPAAWQICSRRGRLLPECLAGAPINLATGDTFIEQMDVRIPGIGGGLELTRTWNSKWPVDGGLQDGSFGLQWRNTYEERVFVGSDGYIKYSKGDGGLWSFGYIGSQVWGLGSPASEHASLTRDANYNWIITFQDGEKRVFDSNGNLITIMDRNGNATQLSYDGIGRISTVTDPASRHLNFGYDSLFSYHVTSVTSSVGHSISYTYDPQGRLYLITKSDGTVFAFEYDAQSRITAVKYANGKLLESHTYDAQGRGLTSSRADGVEAVTVTYPQ